MSKGSGTEPALQLPRQVRQGARRSRSRDRRLARLVRQCQELPGQELFQYIDDGRASGSRSTRATSTTTCARSAARTSRPRTSARGPARCAASMALQEFLEIDDEAGRKKAIVGAIEEVAGAARQHAGRLPRLLRASRRPRRLPRRHDGRRALRARARRRPRRARAASRGGGRARAAPGAAGARAAPSARPAA